MVGGEQPELRGGDLLDVLGVRRAEQRNSRENGRREIFFRFLLLLFCVDATQLIEREIGAILAARIKGGGGRLSHALNSQRAKRYGASTVREPAPSADLP